METVNQTSPDVKWEVSPADHFDDGAAFDVPIDVPAVQRKVTPIHAAKSARRKAKPASEKAEQSLPLRYARYFYHTEELRIGGGRNGRTVYNWNALEARWVAMSDDEARSLATKWLSWTCPDKVDSAKAKICMQTALDLYASDPSKRLPVQDPRRPILPVIGAYLRIDDDGTIRASHPDMNAGVVHRIAAALDWSRVGEDDVYTPRPLPATSRLAQYLDKFVPDLEVRALLQEAVGSSLMPAAGWHKAFCMTQGGSSQIKDGSNGKSTLLKLLSALHPDSISVDLTVLDKDPSAIADLEGKTLAISTETPDFLGKQVEQRLKAIIAGDEVRGRALYQNGRCFEPHLSLWIALNGSGIRFQDRSAAMEERFLWIPFNVRVPRDGPDNIRNFSLLITEDPDEMGVLLDWALEGVARLCRNGKRFSDSPACVKANDELRRVETDPTYAWMVENEVKAAGNEESPKAAVYEAYRQSMLADENRPLAAPQFWRALRGYVEGKLGGVFQERQPTGGARHQPRPSRTVSVTVMGVSSSIYRWGTDPLTTPAKEVLDAFAASIEPIF